MERLSFEVPGLYADHQIGPIVGKVGSLPGVASVTVSPAMHLVAVEMDTAKTTPSAIAEALEALGLAGAGEVVAAPPDKGDPAWYRAGTRYAKTNPQEITMSGEFRKY